MLKVVIADDEDRICQLICALVDWKAMDMEIAGIAHNGLEAWEMVKAEKPQIMITDIRMPGYSGLELIENVKQSAPDLEIIIISGYAHFEYAQTAIKYGVGDYLLKPINKSELNMTLIKLKQKLEEREQSQEKERQLIQKNKKDVCRLQRTLLERLIEQKVQDLSLEILRDEYGLAVKPGMFQVFWVKVDEYMENLNKSGFAAVMEKTVSLLESNIRPKCTEVLIGQSRDSCVGIMNYDFRRQEDIRRVLRDCLNQLEGRKELFGPLTFSMALSGAVKKPELLSDSVREASIMIQERIVKGTGRILERMPGVSSIHERNFLEIYLRQIKHAVEILSPEEGDEVVSELRAAVKEMKDVYGYEVLELVNSCGSLFLSQLKLPGRAEEESAFRKRCGQCSSVDTLFLQLLELQRSYIEPLKKKHESDAERPIRQAKQYMQNHFSEQITLEEVSAAVGLSPAYFSVQFKKAEKEGFAKYLLNIRIEQAKIFLRETNYSVSEICRRVGYNDLKHFTHIFEKATGVKPGIYRKLYG